MVSLAVYKKYLTITATAWGICLVLFVAAHMVLLKPQYSSKQYLEKKLIEKIREHEAAEKAAEEQTGIELREQIARLQERLGDFVTEFENAADLNFDITQIAREKEVGSLSVGSGKSTKIARKNVVDSNSIDENSIEISFVSGFNQFASFVNSLERHKPVIFVHEFKLSRSNQNKSAYQVTLDVRALVKKQRESEIAKATEARPYGARK